MAQTQKSCFLKIDVLPTAVCPSVHLLRTLSRHLSCLRFLMKQSYILTIGAEIHTNEMNRLAHGARFFQFHLVHPVSEFLLGKADGGRGFFYLSKTT